MFDRYDPAQFESKWRKRWYDADLFLTPELPDRPKFYGLDFFPYPSGAGLSVGHCRNYIPTDVLCRLKRMQGYNVLHPMGFDAFGLPAENEAIKNKTHPAPMIERYAQTYQRQMDLVGISYDWSRSFKSSDPSYYKWTQWAFKLLYQRGLAYRKLATVNWCPRDRSVLADEEVAGGLCWRCGGPVEKRAIPQWIFKITDYAQRLLDDLDLVDWPEGIKAMQRNWIGRSEGVEFDLKIAFDARPRTPEAEADGDFVVKSKEREPHFRVFTTRIDTLFGVTFCVLAPEHEMVGVIRDRVAPEHQTAIDAYRDAAKRLSDTDRLATNRKKTGVFTGAYAINPGNGARVPIWIADYVLATYGTGAIMAVPGHDQRDFEFATKFGLEIVPVIASSAEAEAQVRESHANGQAFESEYGVLINSGEYTGMPCAEAQDALGKWMEGLGIGTRTVQYKLRDWLISRQRYWGCPIPVVYDKDGNMELVGDSALPVELPDIDSYEPGEDGASPLAAIDDWVRVTTNDGTLGTRETDTLGGFACSSWYFLRFCDPFNEAEPWNKKLADYWMPVDCYVGGAEHAVMHLLYARFWTKVFYDAGLVSVKEPFQRLLNQGQVLANTPYRKAREGESLGVGEDGILTSFAEAAEIQKEIEAGKLPEDTLFWRWARMSKSKGNVVTPDEAVEAYGADALRIYELFVAPFDADVQWSNDGMQGAVRFLSRIFRLAKSFAETAEGQEALRQWPLEIGGVQSSEALAVRRSLHKTIKKATEDIERFAFNTYVSAMMTLLNDLTDAHKAWGVEKPREVGLAIAEAIEKLALLMSPAAPFSADELWSSLGHEGFTLNESWPEFDAQLTVDDRVTIAIQVNGKLRDTFEVAAETTDSELETLALASPKIQVHLDGKQVRKVIVIPRKLVNVVAN